MLVELTTSVDFIKILCAGFLFKILAPKITKPKFNQRKAAGITFVQKHESKMFVKLTTGGQTVLSKAHLKNEPTKEMYDGNLDNWEFI